MIVILFPFIKGCEESTYHPCALPDSMLIINRRNSKSIKMKLINKIDCVESMKLDIVLPANVSRLRNE